MTRLKEPYGYEHKLAPGEPDFNPWEPSAEWMEWRWETHWNNHDALRPTGEVLTPAQLRHVGLAHLIPAYRAARRAAKKAALRELATLGRRVS